MSYQTVKSVKKAFRILELLMEQTSEKQDLTLAEIAKATGILPVTARNLLRTLEECGYAHRIGHGRYEEGERCSRLFRVEGVLKRLGEVAGPILGDAVGELGESLLLAAIIRGRRVELLRRKAKDDHLVDPHWAANAHPWPMRTTRVLLAWASDEQLEAFIALNGAPSQADWPECGLSREGLLRQLRRIRREGGCADRQGSFMAIAVPILTGGTQIVGSLGCYAPVSRTDKARATGLLRLLHECAGRIQGALAGSA
jgi:DNA-binding IclR family transcriptional regulator